MKKGYHVTKRFVCIVVAIALVLTLLPAAVLAVDAPVSGDSANAAVTVDALAEGANAMAVPFGTAQEAIPFPALKAGDITLEGVTWNCDSYNANAPGDYVFAATLPEGYAPPEGQAQVTVTVTITEEDGAAQTKEGSPIVVASFDELENAA